jgi:hypothetical protein
MKRISKHARSEAEKYLHVAISLCYEVAVVFSWFGASAVIEFGATWAHTSGGPTYCVFAFKWFSSLSLLVVTGAHVLSDVIASVHESFPATKPLPRRNASDEAGRDHS